MNVLYNTFLKEKKRRPYIFFIGYNRIGCLAYHGQTIDMQNVPCQLNLDV